MVQVIIIVVLGVIIVVAIAVAIVRAGWWPPPLPGWWPGWLPWPGATPTPPVIAVTPPTPPPPATPPATPPLTPYISGRLTPDGGAASPGRALAAHITVYRANGHQASNPSVVLTIRPGPDGGITSTMALPAPPGSTTPGQSLGTSTPYIGTDAGYITFDVWGSAPGSDLLEVSMNGVVVGTLPYETSDRP